MIGNRLITLCLLLGSLQGMALEPAYDPVRDARMTLGALKRQIEATQSPSERKKIIAILDKFHDDLKLPKAEREAAGKLARDAEQGKF